MQLKELKQRPGINGHSKLYVAYIQLCMLISELNKKELNDEVANEINLAIEDLNAMPDSDKNLRAETKKKQSRIVRIVEKRLKLVPRNYYRNLWLALGMGAFGVPMGVAFGAILGNMAFIGIGMPIGLAIGIAVGTALDKKAIEEGRQLNLELTH